METRNFGPGVRGGANESARFFLHILPSGGDAPENGRELDALFSSWDEEFGLKGSNWRGRYYRINTRREFALIPAIIRKAKRVGYDVTTSISDEVKGQTVLATDPLEFWKALALAQAFYHE